MAFPPDRSDRAALLHGDARESVRVLALGYLDRTADGSRALRDAPDDPESVHALRVALTRLRGTIRAGAEGLAPTRSARADRPEGVASGAVRAVLGRRTASVLRATHRSLGVVRDLDVQAAALRALAVEEEGEVSAEAHALAERLETRRPAALQAAWGHVHDQLEPRLARCRARLRHYAVERVVGEPERAPTLAQVLSDALRDGGSHLLEAMSAADHTGDRDTWHRVRLAAKPLRALVAPFDGVATELDVLFAALTALQDAIGAARDLHLLRRLARTTAPDARALRVALTARRDALDDAVQTLAADHDRLRDALSAAVRWLDGRRPADLEIERKFLLRALPEAATAAPSVRITQGWLPGERLRERLRRSVFPDGRVEWTRTVKLGTGVTRVEVEEAASPMLFESLWPLTAAARVAKVRYTVATDHATWEIDDFLDRPLVLAEIELPREDAPVTFPEWLAPYVEREVTGEAAYVNANLARATRVPGSA